MKTLILLSTLILSLNFARAATIKELAGTFTVTSPIASGTVVFHEDGSLDAQIQGIILFQCSGTGGVIENDIYSVNSLCWTINTVIRIDLTQVSNFNKFTAPVFTNMAGSQLMEFTRR